MRKEGDREVWPRREEKKAGAGGGKGSAHQDLGCSGDAFLLLLELN